MSLVFGDCLSCWMNESTSVVLVRVRRWSVATGMVIGIDDGIGE